MFRDTGKLMAMVGGSAELLFSKKAGAVKTRRKMLMYSAVLAFPVTALPFKRKHGK